MSRSASLMRKAFAAVILTVALTACASEHRGPFEQAGHDIDKGLDKTGKTVEGAANDAGKTIGKGAKDTGNAFDRFGNDVSDWWHRNFD